MNNENAKKMVKVILPVIIALISLLVISKYAASPDFHAKTIAELDEKRATVLELTAASAATSAAITLLPGDTATPIADKLADLSSCFLIVICAIYLEKYLVTIMGWAAFAVLIPAGCALCTVNACLRQNQWKQVLAKLSVKLIVFGLAIAFVVPASVKVSDMIESTYQSSIDATIQSAKQTTEEIGESAEAEDEGVLSGLISKIENSVTDVTEKVQNVLNNFMEALAVMIVTSCVIPILVLLFFLSLIKMVLGVNISLPKGSLPEIK